MHQGRKNHKKSNGALGAPLESKSTAAVMKRENNMGKIKKEILEKEKIYHERKKSRMPIYMSIVVLIIYAFFFTSKLTIPQPISSKEQVTELGYAEEFAENRTVTLVSAEYSKEQKILELVLNFKNKNYDNVNDYFYSLTSTNADPADIKIDEIFNEDLFTVIRLSNVKKNYREIEFLLAPRIGEISDVTDDMTASIILNKYNVTLVDRIDTSKSREDYLKERLARLVDQLEKNLKRQEKKLEKLNDQKTAFKVEINNSQKEQKYMTAEEIAESNTRNEENQERILQVEEDIRKQESKIAKTKKEIEDAKAKAGE